MLNVTWKFKLEPTAEQVSEIEHTLDVCRNVWNFALRERKDWLDSRKSPVNACSIRQEFILPADAPFPSYARQCKSLTAAKANFPRLKTVNAQVLQQVIRKLEASWESWRLKRSGFPRFKRPNRMRSVVFPQMLKNCVTPDGVKLPQLGLVKVRWSREIPNLFEVKQARIVRHNCGSVKPRDVAAAQVISARGQRVVENACGGEAAGTEVTQSSWHLLKQEIFGATQGISLHTR